jgi:hypothetical protein
MSLGSAVATVSVSPSRKSGKIRCCRDLGFHREVAQSDEGEPDHLGQMGGHHIRRNQSPGHQELVERGAPLFLFPDGGPELLGGEMPLGHQTLAERELLRHRRSSVSPLAAASMRRFAWLTSVAGSIGFTRWKSAPACWESLESASPALAVNMMIGMRR